MERDAPKRKKRPSAHRAGAPAREHPLVLARARRAGGLPGAAFAAATLASAAFAADVQEVQLPAPELAPLTNLVWRLPGRYATLEGDRLVVDIPADDYPADAVATASLPAALFEGAKGFAMSVSAEGEGLARPTKTWLGLKFQMHWKEKASGREAWPNCRNIVGDFPATVLGNDAPFDDARPDAVDLQLGLQGTSGRVVFDLSTLRGAPTQGLFRRTNEDYVVRYPDAAARRQPRRGVMLPGRDPTEEDFAALAEWGATLVRYQMVRRWNEAWDNRDLDEFAAWLDGKLDCLERVVIPCARKYGMKVVVDLHVTPGGRDESKEPTMFREKKYADAFVDTWRRIAARFKGDTDAIYGYDLVNEPLQHGRAPFDCWSLQRRAAEAVREIDPDAPIVFAADGWDTPPAFAHLSPLAMDNVIYQVHCYMPMDFTHQGVASRATDRVWPDPARGWDREYLRRTLEPVREFERRHHARILVGEFSAIAWAKGAENYIADCIALFEEYGWDWTYHAFREWNGWSVEHEGPDAKHMAPSADNPRKRVLLDGLRGAVAPSSGPPAER